VDSKTDKAIDAVARDCIAVRVRLLNRVITNLYDDALRPLGMKVSQLNILVVAAKLGLARPAQVCGLLHLDASTLSRNVERMQAKGWLEVVPDEDGRAQPFRLTPAGRELLGRAHPAWQRAQRQATAVLGDEGVGLLRDAAAKLGLNPA
jgi:DNA-binding MarR family transcriptional regulator